MEVETQKANILKHLIEKSTITPIEALELYHCFRLGARIYDLRKEGKNISTIMIHDGKVRYACYQLLDK